VPGNPIAAQNARDASESDLFVVDRW
jgi:hypothetical protein